MTMSKRFLHANEELLEQFMLHGEDNEELTLVDPVITVTNKVGSPVEARSVVYQKKLVKSYAARESKREAKRSPAIHVVNKDGEYHTTLWETTPAKIQLALKSGLLNPDELEDSPIAQVVADYGQYLKIVAERAVTRKLISKKDVKIIQDEKTNEDKLVYTKGKKAIVDFAQDALLALQDLWECVNNYDESLSPKENVRRVVETISALQDKFLDIYMHHRTGDHDDEASKEAMAEFRLTISSNNVNRLHKIKDEIQRKYLRDDITDEQIKSLFKMTANPSSTCIFHIVQDQIELINTAANRANNRISGLYDRGDLFVCINKARHHTRDMNQKPDYHNSAPRELSLLFDKTTPKDQLVTFDLAKHGGKISASTDLALQLVMLDHLEERGELPRGTKMEGRFGINWTDWHAIDIPRIGVRFVSGLLGFALGDVPFGILNGLSYLLTFGQYPLTKITGYDPARDGYPSEKMERALMKNRFWHLRDPLEKSYADTIGARALEDHKDPLTKIVKHSLTSQINDFFSRQLKKLTVAPIKEIFWRTPRSFFKSATRIVYDWTLGTTSVSDAEITLLLQQKMGEHHAQNEQFSEDIETYVKRFNKLYPASAVKLTSANIGLEATTGKQPDTYNTLEQLFHQRAHHAQKRFARTPRHLQRDKPNDALSGSADGWDLLVKVFLDEIYGNHPVAGMGFTGLGMLGGLPFVAPLLKNYVIISHFFEQVSTPIAKAMVGHTEGVTAGFSTALIEGKLAFCVLDFMKRGPNSFICSIIKDSLQNPAVAIIGIGFSVAVGHLIAFEVQIPWLSEKLEDESKDADFPWPELGLTGIKLAGLVAEGLIDMSEEPEHSMQSRMEVLRTELRTEVVAAYLKRYSLKAEDLTAEHNKVIDETVETYLAWVEKNRTHIDVIKLVAERKKLHEKNPALLQEGEQINEDLNQEQFWNELEIRFQDRLNRERINQLDLKHFSEKEKYRLMQWVQQKYGASDPEYVDAVHAKAYQANKSSPVATSLRTLINYVPETLRLLNLVVQTAYYGVRSYFAPEQYDTAFTQSGANLRRCARQYSKKVRGDLGLIMRWCSKILRINYFMLSAMLVSAATIFIGALALCIAPFESLGRWLLKSNYVNPEDNSFKPKSTFYGFKLGLYIVKTTWNTLTQPKFFTRLFEAMTGELRKEATHKNIRLASQNIDKKQSMQTGISSADVLMKINVSAPQEEKAGETKSATPSNNNKKLLELCRQAFEKFTYSLATVSPAFRDANLFGVKLEIANTIRDSMKYAKKFQEIITQLKDSIVSVRQWRMTYNKSTTGEFEKQLQAALTEAYQLISTAELPIKARAFALTEIQNLIRLNQHGDELTMIKAAFKNLTDMVLPVEPRSNRTLPVDDSFFEAGDIAHIRSIHQKIIDAESNADLDLLWKEIQSRDLDTGRYPHRAEGIGASEMYDQAAYSKSKYKNNLTLYSSRNFVENAYKHIRDGLATLNMQFAHDPEMREKIMSCYRSSAVGMRADVDVSQYENQRGIAYLR